MTAVLPAPVSARGLASAGALVAVWAAAVEALVAAVGYGLQHGFGVDAHAYWVAAQHLTYLRAPGTVDAFLYSPLFADAITPFGWLPWPVFYGLWVAGSAVALGWLLRPVPVRWAVPIALACTLELVVGNIHLLLAAAVVAGLRGSRAAWWLPLLTKIASGVGLIWFVVRGEWRHLAAVAAVLAIVGGCSVLLQPAAWAAWLHLLTMSGTGGTGGTQLVVREVLAVAVVIVAGRTGGAWLVPVAMVIGNPVSILDGLVMLTAIPLLLSRWSSPTRSRSTASAASRPTPYLSTP